ncbi:hypothetical protein AB0D49_12790 [Streptomyces sp. NPDC048290]|uniref:hypothetical protein n=1 Tax=Streptomyces sp. NPDC048290 TaxID=3155811 RepID=UPI0034203AFF
MSEQQAIPTKPLDNQLPVPPAGDDTIVTKDNQMPSPPKGDGPLDTKDNQMPLPPALDLTRDGK